MYHAPLTESVPAKVKTSVSRYQLLADPLLNKRTAFTKRERNAFDLHDLFPPNVETQGEQVSRCLSTSIRLQPEPAGAGFQPH